MIRLLRLQSLSVLKITWNAIGWKKLWPGRRNNPPINKGNANQSSGLLWFAFFYGRLSKSDQQLTKLLCNHCRVPLVVTNTPSRGCWLPSTTVETPLQPMQSIVNNCWDPFTTNTEYRQQLLRPLCNRCSVLSTVVENLLHGINHEIVSVK